MNEHKLTIRERLRNWSVGAAIVDTATFGASIVLGDVVANGIYNVAEGVADVYDDHTQVREYKVGNGLFKKKVQMTPAQYRKTYGSGAH